MKECRATRMGLWVLLGEFASVSIILGAQDPGLLLSSPSVSRNGFQFTLNAESGVSYTIQASTNLLDWVPVGTNADPGITRTITITNPLDGQSFYRAARDPLPLFGFALAANNGIVLSGGGAVDSYDSSDTNYSTDGLYDPAKRKDNASVVSNLRTNIALQTNIAIQVGTSRIYGRVATGPGGTVTITSGSVGDRAWIDGGNVGIQSGYVTDDMNVWFPTNMPPPGPYLPIPPPTLYITYLGNGTYSGSNLSINGGRALIVTGNAILYVTGDVTVTGSGYVYVEPGASLILYIGGRATFTGGGVVNATGLAANFSYYGLPSNTSLVYSGASPLIGTVYAPQANFFLSGGSGMYGAAIVNSFTSSGSSPVHYDENLARVGPTR
jgi:hypothetical protein